MQEEIRVVARDFPKRLVVDSRVQGSGGQVDLEQGREPGKMQGVQLPPEGLPPGMGMIVVVLVY